MSENKTENKVNIDVINKTKVVRIRRSNGKIVQDCDIYIGRACSMGNWNLKASKWGNPFKLSEYSLDEALKKYEEYVRNNKELIASLPELAGKLIGCWCYPKPCHGDILIKLLKEFYGK